MLLKKVRLRLPKEPKQAKAKILNPNSNQLHSLKQSRLNSNIRVLYKIKPWKKQKMLTQRNWMRSIVTGCLIRLADLEAYSC